MMLVTLGALAVGLAIIAFAVLQRPAPEPITDELRAPIAAVPAGLAEGRTLGDANAPVTVEIWSDFQCPACRLLATGTEPRSSKSSSCPVPLASSIAMQHSRASAATLTMTNLSRPRPPLACAAEQGRFWEMHSWLFANWNGENEGAFRAERLREIAAAAGLDLTAVRRGDGHR